MGYVSNVSSVLEASAVLFASVLHVGRLMKSGTWAVYPTVQLLMVRSLLVQPRDEPRDFTYKLYWIAFF